VKENGEPFFVLGGGSNLLVLDSGFAGAVFKMGIRGTEIIHEDSSSVVVKVGAGEVWDEFVAWTVEREFWGIENLSCIPGTVGAAPVQNIGAYGVEAKDVIESVEVFNAKTGEVSKMTHDECSFGYRDSFFKRQGNKHFVVISVAFKLTKIPQPNVGYKDVASFFTEREIKNPGIIDIRSAIVVIRSAKFPNLNKEGTAGSFWKNPVVSNSEYERLVTLYPGLPAFPTSPGYVKVPLAWILDNVCGLKGYTQDGVRLFEKQPLVLVAQFNARAEDVVGLAKKVELAVFSKTQIQIEREVEYVG
jgi:UDP-N-acetylmuramate dehydrogenase